MTKLKIEIDMVTYEIEIENGDLTIRDVWNARDIYNDEIDLYEIESLTDFIIEMVENYWKA